MRRKKERKKEKSFYDEHICQLCPANYSRFQIISVEATTSNKETKEKREKKKRRKEKKAFTMYMS